jgi:hypothetical protein
MNKRSCRKGAPLPFAVRNGRLVAAIAGAAALLASGGAAAARIDTGNSDVTVSWDNTVKYSAAARVRSADGKVAGDPASLQVNTNDGDLNFGKGLISNRLDLLSELEFRYKKDFGFRMSGAAWYDDVYHRRNDNPGTQGVNSQSVATDRFTHATEQLHGQKAEFLDMFGYGNFTPWDMSLNVKAGRYTQLYGESLFFGSNGIAGAQTPLDLARALSVPNSQFKEVARPVGQLGGQLQISPTLSIGAYYQLEWRKSRLPAAGSYFSFADFVDAGGESFNLGAMAPGLILGRGKDLNARDSGQGGMQLKYKSGDAEYGFYAAQFHDKMPQFYVRPGVNPRGAFGGDYVQVFGENIRTVGASFSTLVGETNVAGELSFRDNMPLVAPGNVLVAGADANGKDRNAYATGKTMHLNLSAISVMGASALWEGASFVGEFAFNRRLAISDNPGALDPNATKDASAIQFVFQPEYFQVLPGLDLQVPIGLSYGLSGRSSVNGALFPSEHGGNVSIGVKGDYQKTWQTGLNFTHYYGPSGAVITGAGVLSYANFHGDRDFVSLSVQRTF